MTNRRTEDPRSGGRWARKRKAAPPKAYPLDFRLKVLEQVLVHDEHPALVSRVSGRRGATFG